MILHVASLETVPNLVGFKATPSCNVICKLFFFFLKFLRSQRKVIRETEICFFLLCKSKKKGENTVLFTVGLRMKVKNK